MSDYLTCPLKTTGMRVCDRIGCGLAGDENGNCLIQQALQIYVNKNRPIDISQFAEYVIQSVKPIQFKHQPIDEKHPHGGCYEDLSDLIGKIKED